MNHYGTHLHIRNNHRAISSYPQGSVLPALPTNQSLKSKNETVFILGQSTSIADEYEEAGEFHASMDFRVIIVINMNQKNVHDHITTVSATKV